MRGDPAASSVAPVVNIFVYGGKGRAGKPDLRGGGGDGDGGVCAVRAIGELLAFALLGTAKSPRPAQHAGGIGYTIWLSPQRLQRFHHHGQVTAYRHHRQRRHRSDAHRKLPTIEGRRSGLRVRSDRGQGETGGGEIQDRQDHDGLPPVAK